MNSESMDFKCTSNGCVSNSDAISAFVEKVASFTSVPGCNSNSLDDLGRVKEDADCDKVFKRKLEFIGFLKKRFGRYLRRAGKFKFGNQPIHRDPSQSTQSIS